MADEIVKQESDLGKLILGEAQKQYRQERQDKVVAFIKRYLDLRGQATKQIRFLEGSVDWYNRKLKALEDGDFKFDPDSGELHFEGDLERANY